MQTFENWIVEEKSHVATLSLNREEKGNTLDTETLIELGAISEALRTRTDIWSVVVRSAGRHFSTGFDPEVIRKQIEESEDSIRDMITSQHRSLALFESIGKPVIAAIRGFCIGAGVLLALCCDFRIASERTVFSLPEIRLGIPILWDTQRIVRTVGAANAKELIMVGDRYRAKRALEFGLVHRVVKDGELDSAVNSLVSKLHKSPPLTQRLAKKIIDESLDPRRRGTEDLELDAIAELLSSPDVAEAMDCYFEGRAPHFSGE
jgi:enoyl-CoA hydratase/carnithine racemase